VRRIPSFVYGHVLGALLIGIVGGAFLDLTAVMVFGGGLTVSAAASAFVCWWWPGFAGAGWKLWLAGTFGNPLLLVGGFFAIADWECLVGGETGWNCMFAEVGPLAVGVCLLPPLFGLALRWISTRRAKS
jgi:hypothetical protein